MIPCVHILSVVCLNHNMESDGNQSPIIVKHRKIATNFVGKFLQIWEVKTEMYADALKQMRIKAGMTLEQVSKQSGVPMSTISRISSGETKDPSFSTIIAIVEAMGGNLSDLMSNGSQSVTEAHTGGKQCDGDNCTMIKLYERQRLADAQWRETMTQQHDSRIDGIKKLYENRISTIEEKYLTILKSKDKNMRILMVIIIVGAILATALVFADLFVANNGWLRR